jgi:sodium/bile acid cotransporter 7
MLGVLLSVAVAVPADAENLARIRSMYARYAKRFKEVAAILPGEALEKKAVFVDVRPPEETEVSVIPGAVLRSEFEEREDAYRDRLIVPYCTIGYRSGKYARRLQRRGFRVRNLLGGVLMWAHAVGPLEAGGKPVRRVHVYGRRWDLAPASFETVR